MFYFSMMITIYLLQPLSYIIFRRNLETVITSSEYTEYTEYQFLYVGITSLYLIYSVAVVRGDFTGGVGGFDTPRMSATVSTSWQFSGSAKSNISRDH